jgi:ATP-dependent Clp protease protease subunit
MKVSTKKQQSPPKGPQVDHEPCMPSLTDDIIESFLFRTRRLLVIGEINEISSTYICNYLQGFSLTNEPIYMYINSPGGCLASGYAIIDQMLACKCPIYTIIRGQAHSMGAVIAAFGEKGHRYATPNSSVMLHSLTIQNPPTSLEHHTEMITYIRDDYKKKMTDMAKRLKLNTKQLIELMNETKWMSPQQAIKIGLIDKIWTPHMEQAVNKGL